MKRAWIIGLLLLSSSCGTFVQQRVEHLAKAQVASDFESYPIHRVGLLPVIGRELDEAHAKLIQSAFYTELSLQTPYEVVPLDHHDLEEIHSGEPYIRGRYEPQMVIDLGRRFRFDAMFVGTVIEYSSYSPLRLSMQMDMIATETGASIWSSAVQLDSSSDRVRKAVKAFYLDSGAVDAEDGKGWELALLSPRLFAQFGAWQIAKLL